MHSKRNIVKCFRFGRFSLFTAVESSNGPGDEIVFKPVCPAHYAPVPPAQGQEVELVLFRVGRFFDYFLCPAETQRAGDVL